jgi:hypothetical protein
MISDIGFYNFLLTAGIEERNILDVINLLVELSPCVER